MICAGLAIGQPRYKALIDLGQVGPGGLNIIVVHKPHIPFEPKIRSGDVFIILFLGSATIARQSNKTGAHHA